MPESSGRAATAADVALAVGVSTATVSRALRGRPGVSEALREQVVSAAAEMGYQTSRSASSLASGTTMTIGILTPYVERWYYGQLIAGAEREFARAGFDVLLYSVCDDAARKRFFEQLPARRRVDALLVLLELVEAETAALRSLGIPLVSNFAGSTGLPAVELGDAATAAATAVQHLLNLGHRRIAMIGATVDDGHSHSTTPSIRRDAYRATLTAAGITPVRRWEVDGDFTLAGGERAMTELLTMASRPTAVFAQSDEMAIGALGALRRHGLAAPGDMSIVGIDDHDMAEVLGLTTVAQPVQQQGVLAARLLLELLDDPHGGQQAKIPIRLVVRTTTGPPPVPVGSRRSSRAGVE